MKLRKADLIRSQKLKKLTKVSGILMVAILAMGCDRLAHLLHHASPSGNVYYVSTTGDDHNPGSEGAPFRTIQKGVDTARAGDAVLIRKGVYHEVVTESHSGTQSAPIVISGYPGEKAVIDGEKTLPRGEYPGVRYKPLFGLNQVGYLTVKNLSVINSRGRGIVIYAGSHILLRNLNASYNWLDGIRIHKGCSNVVVEDCSVGDCNQDWNPDNRPSEDPTNSWSASLVVFKSDSCTLHGNRVYECYGEGINNLESNNSVIEDNVVYDNAKVNIYSDRTKFPVIQRNLVYMTGNKRFWRYAGNTPATPTPGIVVNDEASDNASTGQKIVNNIIYNCGTGFGIWGLDNTDSLLFANNTIVNTIPGASGDACVGINITGHVGIAGSVVTNNIIYHKNNGVLIEGPTGGLAFSFNNWADSVGPAYAGKGDVVGNPALELAGDTERRTLSADYFRLAAFSPAIDAAQPLGRVTQDFFGNTRGGRPDIGAYEYHQSGDR